MAETATEQNLQVEQNLDKVKPQQETPALPSGMTKKIIQQGEGEEMPQSGFEVSVHYSGKFEDGKEFDSSYSRGEPFNFTIGTGSVIPGWDIALKTMKRNEIAEFSLPPELAYGEKGTHGIPPNSRLNFEIELLEFSIDGFNDPKPIYRMTLEERLNKCQEKKDEGGAQFKDGKFDQAIRSYRDVMKFAEISEFRDDGKVVELDSCQNSQMPAESDQDKAKRMELKQMLLTSYLNLALCYLKVNKLKECIANCDQALKLDPKNVKAHFRKGLAYLPTKDYEKGVKQFDLVLELDPGNAEAKAKKAFCNNELRDYYQKQKELYKVMFKK